jgi:hypothetical protein
MAELVQRVREASQLLGDGRRLPQPNELANLQRVAARSSPRATSNRARSSPGTTWRGCGRVGACRRGARPRCSIER